MRCRRGRGQQKQNTTVRGDNNANANDSNDGNYGLMVPIDVEDAYLKTRVHTVVMYHRYFQHCKADNCQYRWTPDKTEPHNMLFKMQSYRWGGMQKIVDIIGKIFCQTHTFAFIICLALSKQDEMCKKKIYMGNYYFQDLTQKHAKLLQHYGYWEHILKRCQNLIDNANSELTG